MIDKQELVQRAIKFSIDLHGDEITECFQPPEIITACIMRNKHPCRGCNLDNCKHYIGKKDYNFVCPHCDFTWQVWHRPESLKKDNSNCNGCDMPIEIDYVNCEVKKAKPK